MKGRVFSRALTPPPECHSERAFSPRGIWAAAPPFRRAAPPFRPILAKGGKEEGGKEAKGGNTETFL